ncbi:zinc ribbon domain-containing protein [Allostreptomyces psammosilenae]|uniref:NAD glycohydrolase translocation F5/8 type C domain-containing protein n=1 Tax=Allostreptomyces psammosilenae TaxID=1892865 RepID=A0A852ZRJ3_9ACTN|nr:zinc ribbon domain-containing protein [Allostreptomyces psammosilenae]NYI03900.1 hypothetical protein [Allostreptomyces psammosilenae]
MICPECGHRNAPGTAFCASCAAFLDWEEEPDRPAPSERLAPSERPAPLEGPSPSERPRGGEPVRPPEPVTGPPAAAPAERSVAAQASGTPAPPAAAAGAASRTGATAPPPSVPPVAGSVPPRPAVPPTVPARPAPAEAPRRPAADSPGAGPGGPGGPSAPGGPSGPGGPTGPGARPAEPVERARLRRPDEVVRVPADGGPPDAGRSAPVAPEPPDALPYVSGARPCPSCGTGNPPDRTLCRRCGSVLAVLPASMQRRTPWWRRRRRRTRQPTAAGDRPLRRVWRRPSMVLPITLLVLLGGAWFGRAQISQAIDYVRDRTAAPAPVHPGAVRASSEAPDHPAAAAFDGASNRYWSPAQPGNGAGEYLEADFDTPVRLRALVIFAGASANQDEFLAMARPAEIVLTLHPAEGEPSTEVIRLSDRPGQQTFDVRAEDVVRVRLTVNTANGVQDGRSLAIAEVEFFHRR